MRAIRSLILALPLCLLAGCPVFQPQDTPISQEKVLEPTTGTKYWKYVPSNYSRDRDWPLVVTLHGTIPWDTYTRQIKEWKSLAEDKGFIVVAPDLESSQGLFPIFNRQGWYRDLERDERVILAVMEDVRGHYRIDADPNAVLLTGFSAGGFAMWHTGLRNPSRFGMLVSMSCNSDVRMMEDLKLVSEEARRMRIRLFWGKDENIRIAKDGWEAFEYLRTHGFKQAGAEQVKGGHLRRPEKTYKLWAETCLPARHRG
jgi:poly(3-hydroxybutyrate) depolymerase